MFMKSVSVFCASSPGFDSIWMNSAYQVGQVIAQRKIKLIYGGGQVGLMGAVADGAMAHAGEVIGVIPHFLNKKEIAHHGISELKIVENMHQRKMLMNDLSEGIIALPGGFGTLEELFEMITWGQLGLHNKPVGILNINGFYDHLIAFVTKMVSSGLLKQKHQEMLLIDDSIEKLLDKMNNYTPPEVEKWMTSDET